MQLPRIALQNSKFTLIIFLLMIIFGVQSFLNMPRKEDPTVYIPGGSIIIIYPGASPKDLEQLVALPVEEAVNELDDIETIKTELKDGISVTNVEFTFDTDAKEKYDELVRQVNAIRNELPEDIYSLEIMQWSSTDVATMQLALVSENAPYNRLEDRAEKLKRNIETIQGVKKVELYAIPREEVRISLDMEKMALMNIPLAQVVAAIESNNQNIPGGAVVSDGKSFMIKSGGGYDDLDEIKKTVVHSANGRIVHLDQIADVRFSYSDINYLARYQGSRAVFMTVMQKDGYNIFDVTEKLKPTISRFQDKLEPDIHIEFVFDQSEGVERKIGRFLSNLSQGIFLVGLVVLLALGLKSSLIVIMAIPLSILIALGVVDLAGFGLQQISIAALVVALGLLVDNSIVMIENIDRFRSMGYPPKEAAIQGASQIGWPVITATLTTLFAFIPIITLQDKAGDFIKSLPITILATLSASLLIALTLTPLVAGYIYKDRSHQRPPDDSRSGNRTGNIFRRILNRLIEGPYRQTLQWSLRKKSWTIIMAILVLLGSASLMPMIGLSFFPPSETPEFMVRIEMDEGTDIYRTNELARQVERKLDSMEMVQHYATNVGHGNPRIYYNIMSRNYAPNYSEIYVRLKRFELEEYTVLVNRLRSEFAGIPGAKVTIKEYQQGVPVEAPIMIDILGENLEVLRNLSGELEQILQQTSGVINTNNKLVRTRTDLRFNVNKEKAGMLGVPIGEIERTIRVAINGMAVASFRDDEGEEYDIVLRLPIDDHATPEMLDRVMVGSMAQKFIPLRQLGSLQMEESPAIISRYNLQRTALVTADLEKGYSLDRAIEPARMYLENLDLPPGFSVHIGGELENRNETFGGMATAALIAMIAIFAVLVLQFNSFRQPLIIFVTVPLAVIGSLWALFLSGYTFSFTAFVGLVSLIGIVVNNAIILVDYMNILVRNGKPLLEAIQEAGETRFTPIVLTTLTTIGGLLPLTLRSGEMWAPLGWTIIGGLLASTFLTLIMVPVFYAVFEGTVKGGRTVDVQSE
jgi:multidrug efflux pump subunit AcrB